MFINKRGLTIIISLLLSLLLAGQSSIASQVEITPSINTLSPQTPFDPLGNDILRHRSKLEFTLAYILNNSEIKDLDLRITLRTDDDLRPIFNFQKKYREGDNWIIPCSLSTTSGSITWQYEAIIDPNRNIKLRNVMGVRVTIEPDEVISEDGSAIETYHLTDEAKEDRLRRSLLEHPEKNFEAISNQFARIGDVHQWEKAIAIFGGSRIVPGSELYTKLSKLGGALREKGYARKTGGGPGAMEAPLEPSVLMSPGDGVDQLNDANEKRQGIKIYINTEAKLNPHVGVHREFTHFPPRKRALFENTTTVIIAPGGIGTIDEFMESLVLGMPIVLFGEDYWRPIYEATLSSLDENVREKYENIILITDSVDEAISFAETHSHFTLKTVDERIEKVIQEINTGIKKLAKLPPSIVVAGKAEPSDVEDSLIRETVRELVENDVPVRAATDGDLLKLMNDLENIDPDLLQSTICEEADLTHRAQFEKKLPGTHNIVTNDVSAHHMLVEMNSLGYVFFPGDDFTLNVLFDVLVSMQTNVITRKPIVLVGKDYWEGLMGPTFHQILNHFEFKMMADEDSKLVTIVETAGEAVKVLKEAGALDEETIDSQRSKEYNAFLEKGTGDRGPQLKLGQKEEKEFSETFIGDISNVETAAKGLLGAIGSLALSENCVLAFDGGLGEDHSSEISSLVRAIEALKNEKKFKELLKNLKIVRGSPDELNSKLSAIGSEKSDTKIFLFARNSSRHKLSKLEAFSRATYIKSSEKSGYFPLAEIVTIAIAEYMDPDVLKSEKFKKTLKDACLKEVVKDGSALIFTVLPNAEAYDEYEILEKYSVIRSVLSAA